MRQRLSNLATLTILEKYGEEVGTVGTVFKPKKTVPTVSMVVVTSCLAVSGTDTLHKLDQ